jgi:hypothetical protein
MGKFRSLIYFTGRTGNVVGRKGPNGEFITSMHQPTVNQPNTEAQQALKAKLKLVSSTMNKFVAIAKQTMIGQNGRNYWQELIAANLDEAVTGSLNLGFEMDFSKVVIANGALDLPFNAQGSVDSNTLSVTWADNSGIGTAKATDTVYAAIYNKDKEQVIYNSLAARSERNGTLTIPTAWNSDGIEVWLYVKAEATRNESKTYSVSGTQYIGSFTV